jgi:uncharacterized protein (UPF0276 family)
LSGIAGIGIGLRKPFAAALLETEQQVDWLEVTPENWVFYGGKARRMLDACAERWPLVPHSVSLDVGGLGPLDPVFLDAIAGLVKRAGAPFWSDHLCYSSLDGRPLHDLLPLPFTPDAVENAAGRAKQAQDRVGAPLVLENATYYAVMPGSVMDEASFLRAALAESGCRMLLDVNNVYVNGKNHGFDPYAFIDRLPLGRVEQLHVAGHTQREELIIDTHIGPVPDPVWALYRHTLRRAGRLIPTLVEWDAEIPPLAVMLGEVDRARAHAAAALAPADPTEPEVRP